MKQLIKTDYIYYLKSKTKLILSIAFILSFIGVIFFYDSMELSEIKDASNYYRSQSYLHRHNSVNTEDFWKEFTDVYGSPYAGYTEFGDPIIDESVHEFWRSEEGINTLSRLEMMGNNLWNASYEMYETLNAYATLHAGGRMNVELTSYRYEINRQEIQLYEIILNSGLEKATVEFVNELMAKEAFDIAPYEELLKERDRIELLNSTNTPDNFNYYTITNANYLSKVFEGLSLFIILTFILVLFYDLFAKDFDTRAYRTIFSSPFPRSKIILAKLIFAFTYTVILISIGMLIAATYMMLQKRVGYNVLMHRRGYALHPVYINLNPLSFITQKPKLFLAPMIMKDIISLVTGLSIIGLWISLINFTSFKLKSSSSTLTIGLFVLLSVFFVNFIDLRVTLTYIFPIFGFGFDYILNGEVGLNFIYIIIVNCILIFLLNKFFFKDILVSDILDGDSND